MRASLAEDLGLHPAPYGAPAHAAGLKPGDRTTEATVPAALTARARVVARQPLVLAGLVLVRPLIEELEAMLGDMHEGDAPPVTVVSMQQDGETADAGAVVCELAGGARTLLVLERTLLNYLAHLSGIATKTASVVRLVRDAGSDCAVLDTRKTTPGLRYLEKYSVACGGGTNHRFGLFDAVLIKDNHVVAAGGIGPAVKRALASTPDGMRIEVECDHMEQVFEALEAGATALLLDNFTPEQVAAAVEAVAGRARIEVSGGITEATIADFARSGPDEISVGALTHSATSVDLSLEIELDS